MDAGNMWPGTLEQDRCLTTRDMVKVTDGDVYYTLKSIAQELALY